MVIESIDFNVNNKQNLINELNQLNWELNTIINNIL